MNRLLLFAQLAKIDEARREVWGVATAEVVDKDGEIFDYESSKPYFKSWSDEISKATYGKSLGNVREMHEPSAVGKLVDLTFDDDLKQIRVGAKIVDEPAWQKCLLGVYTGFSIGGRYEKAWKDGEFVRFTAAPAEISVVDNPCVPGAHFTAIKVDGSTEVRKFAQRAAGHGATVISKDGQPVRKDLGTVSTLAYILQSACSIQMDSFYEAEYEQDGSALPGELKAWVAEGAAILARMTQEELNELMGTMKFTSDRVGKKGAKHSAATKAHHDAIQECMKGINKCVKDAQGHLDALGKDADASSVVMPAVTKKNSAATPEIQTGETEMLDAKEKELLDKAVADSASAKTQLAAINTKLDTMAEMFNKFVKAISGEPADAQKVSRTAVPSASVTVTKTQDAVRTTPSVQELTPEELRKLTPAQQEARFHAGAAVALQKSQPILHTPGRSAF